MLCPVLQWCVLLYIYCFFNVMLCMYDVVLYGIVLYGIVLYAVVLYCVVLYCNVT